jgi:hypothetical protein
MRMKWLAPSLALSAVLFGVINVRAQVVIGPNSKGGFNAYMRESTAKFWAEAEADAKVNFPGYTVNGVEIVPANTTKGRLVSLQGKAEADFVLSSVGTGWLGLTDSSDFGGEEGGNTAAMDYPKFKTGSTELREVPQADQRGFGWVWTSGEPFDYQNWGAGEPNNAGVGENTAELVGGGAWNDLTGDDSTPDQIRNGIVEWDLKFATHPLQIAADIAVDNGKLVGKAAGRTSADFGSKEVNVSWAIQEEFTIQLRAPSAGVTPGGLSAAYYEGNLNSKAAFDNAIANAQPLVPEFKVPKISWGNDTPNRYPTAIQGAPGFAGNRDNYSARYHGEIFIPQGTVTFRDHNDDYTYLEINGEQLIEDGAWTSWDGTGNTGGTGGNPNSVASFEGTKSDATVEGLKGGWYPIDFRGAEGGGGDNFRLLWDATNVGTNEAKSNDPASVDEGIDYWTVGSPFLRAADTAGLTLVTRVPLGFMSVDGGGPGGLGDNKNIGSAEANVPMIGANGLGYGELGGVHTLVLTATACGLTQTVTKTLDFGGGTGGPKIPGDVDNNGKVDLTDFGILKSNFGKTAPPGAAAVPEPSTLALLGLGGLFSLIAAVRRRRA